MKITEIVYAVFYYMCNICFYLNTAVNWGYWGWDRNKQDFKIFFFLQSESTIEDKNDLNKKPNRQINNRNSSLQSVK